mgnify:CR=1 FL=1|jgi:hypothetical protein|tara:strand:+ start:1525 stop:2082 length:558 start_codon:yes stop_codon:yes gene_type:complete
MAGTVINDKLQAQNGFESPNFTVDNTGKITAPTIDVKNILLNGTTFVQYVPPEEDSGDDTGTQVSNSFESLAVTGGVFKVNYLGNTVLSVINGRLTINNQGIPGNIDNVDIGYNVPVQIRAYGIDMTTAPDSTASQLNVDGATMNGDLTVTNNMLLQSDPTIGTHATNKGYVDATATALAVAFGA